MGAALIPLSEVLNRLTKVFREEGYDSATLSRLSLATGLGKASLYHYFPGGKEQMAKAVLERSNQRFHEMVIAPLCSDAPPVERLERMIDNLDAYYAGGEESCLLGVMAMGGNVGLFQDHIREGLANWLRSLAEVLRQAGLADEDAQMRAEDAIFRIEGALLVGRGLGEAAYFRRMLGQLKRQLVHATLQ
ncbi:TetR/AcrR family transcriptional regulator [Parapusillimonas sp. SGNA-6]|nr:TetR/AcrR family transcriptional regulator [Parapusillimonas sp. SGNA-6]